MNPVRILPSLLAADIGALAADCRRVADAGADGLHIDIMDAHFVPNLSFSPAVVEMARRAAPGLPRNVHLMMERPELYAGRFIEAGATTVLIHVEAPCDVRATLAEIRRLGARCGLALNPGTPPAAALPFLGGVDEILCMTVRPGYGGQAFMPEVLPRIAGLRAAAPRLDIMVDGGVNLETAARCAAHGANAFVAGTHLFRAPCMAAAIRELRAATA